MRAGSAKAGTIAGAFYPRLAALQEAALRGRLRPLGLRPTRLDPEKDGCDGIPFQREKEPHSVVIEQFGFNNRHGTWDLWKKGFGYFGYGIVLHLKVLISRPSYFQILVQVLGVTLCFI